MKRYRDAPLTGFDRLSSLYSLSASEALMIDAMYELYSRERKRNDAEMSSAYEAKQLTLCAAPRTRSSCTKCGQVVYADGLDYHLSWCGVPKIVTTDGFERLPFHLLPPSSGSQMDSFAQHIKLPSFEEVGQVPPDWSRIHFIEKFKPNWKAWGETAWHGYAVFTFDFTDIVVLESVHYAQAMYLLRGDWQEMVQYSKAEIRQEFHTQHRRVTHTSGYQEIFQRLLRNGWI
jgi:hypothetical protein